jgi:predicted SprT family Zn-dependent metalloprotease
LAEGSDTGNITGIDQEFGAGNCNPLTATNRKMAETHHRTCKCGAVYNRSESMAPWRQMSSFKCAVCGATMESWNTA